MGTATALDMSGLRCPAPIVRLNSAIRELAPGATLHAIATDPAFKLDVEAWCRRTGHTLLDFSAADGTLQAWIRKAI
jgi:tRNA 2-thiouridine synthesizing protein A